MTGTIFVKFSQLIRIKIVATRRQIFKGWNAPNSISDTCEGAYSAPPAP